LEVGEQTNAGFGDFRAVSVEIDGRRYGVDVYLGRGDAPETDGKTSAELTDWADGNGLLARGLATEAQVWALVDEVEAEMLGIEPDTTIELVADEYAGGASQAERTMTIAQFRRLCAEMGWRFPSNNRNSHGQPVWTLPAVTVLGCSVQSDRSGGQGHNWVPATADTCPPSTQEEIAAEITDGVGRTCDDYVASNGQHYRWEAR
jgi:hypothetical protein